MFNIFLQLLDDGRLTDGQGRVVDFKNTIIIMTSNLGSELIMEAAEAGQDSDDGKLMQQIDVLLKQRFKPEFLNRIDETVMFNRLGKEHVKGIVKIQLDRVAARLADRRIGISFTPAALDLLADLGYDPAFGARPVKRAIQNYIENPLAKALLSGSFAENAKISVDAEAGSFVFK